MSQFEDQIITLESEFQNQTSKHTQLLFCCICRKEILEDDSALNCPLCKTIFHSKHLFLWLDYKQICPICNCFLSLNESYPKRSTGRLRRKKGKVYRCYYCNYKWEINSFGHPLWCPECGITSCPQCNAAFGFEFLLGHLQSNGSCPNCNQHISIESLKAKIKVLNIN